MCAQQGQTWKAPCSGLFMLEHVKGYQDGHEKNGTSKNFVVKLLKECFLANEQLAKVR